MKEINRVTANWLSEKKLIDAELESDTLTRKVRVWIKHKDDLEPKLDTLKKRLMPGYRYENSAQWFLTGDEFLSWCPPLEDPVSKDTSMEETHPSNRLLWVRGGLGTGKTNVLYVILMASKKDSQFEVKDFVTL